MRPSLWKSSILFILSIDVKNSLVAAPPRCVVVPVLLIAVALLAAYGPARRASRIDPMKALREE